MIKRYIATFFSHFGAIRFERELRAIGIKGIVKPVPRTLSSSCGTCVEFKINTEEIQKISDKNFILHLRDDGLNVQDRHNEIEQVVEILEEGYRSIYKAKD